MKKIHQLRRLAVILLAICAGMLLGQFGNNFIIVTLVMVFVLWLLAYDFATEERYWKQKGRSRNVKSNTESSHSKVS